MTSPSPKKLRFCSLCTRWGGGFRRTLRELIDSGVCDLAVEYSCTCSEGVAACLRDQKEGMRVVVQVVT